MSFVIIEISLYTNPIIRFNRFFFFYLPLVHLNVCRLCQLFIPDTLSWVLQQSRYANLLLAFLSFAYSWCIFFCFHNSFSSLSILVISGALRSQIIYSLLTNDVKRSMITMVNCCSGCDRIWPLRAFHPLKWNAWKQKDWCRARREKEKIFSCNSFFVFNSLYKDCDRNRQTRREIAILIHNKGF